MELSLHFQAWKVISAYKRRDVLAWHTPNGEKRDKRTAARLRAMGVVKGVADFTVIVAGIVHFLELKDRDGRQDASQRVFQCEAEAAGAHYHVARTIDEVCTILNDIGAMRLRLTTSILTSSGVRGGPGAQPHGMASVGRGDFSPRGTVATA